MSFFLTPQQVIKETKTVTRRLGWNHATPGGNIALGEFFVLS